MNKAAQWREFRMNNNLSLEDMAKAAGVCEKTVRNIEKAKHQPTYKTQRKLEALKERYRRAKDGI
jgi:DNA-binding XRE family transcriptional regulator